MGVRGTPNHNFNYLLSKEVELTQEVLKLDLQLLHDVLKRLNG